MSLRFQIASDLHIEEIDSQHINTDEYITPIAPILILAGDIGNLYKKKQLYNFLEELCEKFAAVIYIPGNHEYYKIKSKKPMPFYKLNFILRELEDGLENLYILRQDCLEINGVIFAGCTLWSKYVLPYLPKFIVRIKGFTKEYYNSLYYRDLKFIKKVIKYCSVNKKELVIITHHLPTYQIETFKKMDKYASLYFSNLDYILKNHKIHTWICGHIHYNFDIRIDTTRLVCNQKGKIKDKICDYSKKFLIEI
jgi:UDP-2,3-diacylglucosamine pyrophosphatase LpxH